MTNAEIFIEKFKELENLLRNKFGIQDYSRSVLKEIENKPQFRHLKDDLNYIREIRNILQHKPSINGEFPIQPNSEINNNMQRIIDYINNPPKAYNYCIKIDNVCYADKDDIIFPYMQAMKENVYTHIPILDSGVVKGVFSENTLFGALIEDELVYEKDKTTFSSPLIKKYSELNNHASESFEFIRKDLYLEDVKVIFRKNFIANKRLAMVFITQNGRPEEKLLGIITPWDILIND